MAISSPASGATFSVTGSPGGSALVLRADRVLTRVGLRYRAGATVGLMPEREVRLHLADGSRATVSTAGVPHDLLGPLDAGSPVGAAVIRIDGRAAARVALVTDRSFTRASLGQRARDFLSRDLTLASLGILVGCSLLLAWLRARAARRRRIPAKPGPTSDSPA